MKSLEQKAKQKVVKCGWGAGSCTLSALGSECVSGCCKRLSSRWRSHSVLTQGSNFARCPNQKQINQDSKTICRSQSLEEAIMDRWKFLAQNGKKKEKSYGSYTKTCTAHFPAFASYSCLLHSKHVCISRDEMEMIDAKEVSLWIASALKHAWVGLLEMSEGRQNC